MTIQSELFAQTDSTSRATQLPDFEAMDTLPLGKTFGSFETENLSTSQIDNLFQNKIVFINFWFTHCTPCLSEVKGLNALYDSLKNDKSFQFISITYDPIDVVNDFKKKHGIQYPVFSLSKDKIKELNFFEKYPTSIIIDTNRIIKYFHVGAFVGEDDDIQKDNFDFILTTYYPIILSEIKLLRPT